MKQQSDRRREMSHDEKCWDLAKYFYPDAAPGFLDDLADEIQSLIEDADESEFRNANK